MTALKWTSLSAIQTSLSAIVSIAQDGRRLGAEIDNTSGRDLFGDWELVISFDAAPSAGDYIELNFIQALDDTNYSSGDESTDPPATAWVGNFPLLATTAQQRINVRQTILPPSKFKPLIINKALHTSSSAATNILRYRTYGQSLE